eukprot:7388365-Prymnesium_polylepis.1
MVAERLDGILQQRGAVLSIPRVDNARRKEGWSCHPNSFLELPSVTAVLPSAHARTLRVTATEGTACGTGIIHTYHWRVADNGKEGRVGGERHLADRLRQRQTEDLCPSVDRHDIDVAAGAGEDAIAKLLAQDDRIHKIDGTDRPKAFMKHARFACSLAQVLVQRDVPLIAHCQFVRRLTEGHAKKAGDCNTSHRPQICSVPRAVCRRRKQFRFLLCMLVIHAIGWSGQILGDESGAVHVEHPRSRCLLRCHFGQGLARRVCAPFGALMPALSLVLVGISIAAGDRKASAARGKCNGPYHGRMLAWLGEIEGRGRGSRGEVHLLKRAQLLGVVDGEHAAEVGCHHRELVRT